jgi:hypothetical protein
MFAPAVISPRRYMGTSAFVATAEQVGRSPRRPIRWCLVRCPGPLIAMAAAILSLASAAPADAAEETAGSGSVRAVLSYEEESPRDMRISIFRGEQAVVGEPLTVPAQKEEARPLGESNLHLRNLEAGAEPAVTVDFSNGGNDCCRYTRVYTYQAATDSYRALTFKWMSWDEPEWRDLNHDGVFEAIDGDGRFYFQFACKACSRLPPVIWAFEAGRFANVTREYPEVVSKHAASLKREYLTQRRPRSNRDVRGILAAYVADEYLLGHGPVGWGLVDSAYRGGYLISYSLGEVNKFEPSPAAYRRELRSFLRRLHYR